MNILNPSIPFIFNPRRRDRVVKEMASELGNYLSWLSHPYGRAYKLDKKVDNYRVTYPAVYNSEGNYLHVGHNSFLTGSTYFILGRDNYLEDVIVQFNMSIIFMVNLKKIFPTVEEYHITERLIEQAEHVLRLGYPEFKFENTEHEFEDVFKEFDDNKLHELKRYPLDSFRINGIFTLNLACLGVDVLPGDQGPLTGEVSNFNLTDGNNFILTDGNNFVLTP